jgi:hypothetical protein
MIQFSYLVCPLGQYRKFYQFDVYQEWAERRICIFHEPCKGAITFTRDPQHDYLRCKRCGSRLTTGPGEAFPAIRSVAIGRRGTHSVSDQIRFTYLDPGDLPADW